MDIDNLDGAVLALGLTGAGFTVLEPPELVALVQVWADRLAAAGSPALRDAGPTPVDAD